MNNLLSRFFQRQFCFNNVIVAISSRTEAKIACNPPETSAAHPTETRVPEEVVVHTKGSAGLHFQSRINKRWLKIFSYALRTETVLLRPIFNI